MRVEALINDGRVRVERVLLDTLRASPCPEGRLEEAMRYSVLGGGKRLRPVLVYAAGQAVGGDMSDMDAPAAAVELIHAYSLVHDDLPAMDDDDLRRGQPTCHRAFDEATAILAGDALQTLAFETLAESGHPRAMAMFRTLARASGRRGMAGGQALDLGAVGREITLDALTDIHRHKTGALIEAALVMGGLTALEEDDERLEALRRYGRAIGLAFQVQDDILDVTGDTAIIGKIQGADALRDKPTYPALLGLDEARHKAQALLDEALDALAVLGDAAHPLAALARYMIERDH
ncbi:(2E,6E)-farnesyl diphosphate synthase [Larsenimonas rhizosphaerae]|uniref:(2E,6E)-farnesyl diphosphate synthase n=1 Tax=Larsenimonas rhizosphaerae TaxID=2944682 RepID=A0AA41ZLR4_9GAMM|nr:farnesyl diphosphate synthase [Larsenimonas rhizosphaerae]MCM2129487.1 (2E,6E)-farnesyl diphosphate synthase [Larsenimonas rhizosphaerae]MCX2524143.1 (2E,6E)-farnesyl diphosphate synthase [Larsenimonas rhizosphaerae]